MKLLCKLVTNPLKPMACAHPINLCNSLGSGLSDLHHCIGCGRGPWLESLINFPFLPVALSWRPSLFPLGDSDIGHNRGSAGPVDPGPFSDWHCLRSGHRRSRARGGAGRRSNASLMFSSCPEVGWRLVTFPPVPPHPRAHDLCK